MTREHMQTLIEEMAEVLRDALPLLKEFSEGDFPERVEAVLAKVKA